MILLNNTHSGCCCVTVHSVQITQSVQQSPKRSVVGMILVTPNFTPHLHLQVLVCLQNNIVVYKFTLKRECERTVVHMIHSNTSNHPIPLITQQIAISSVYKDLGSGLCFVWYEDGGYTYYLFRDPDCFDVCFAVPPAGFGVVNVTARKPFDEGVLWKLARIPSPIGKRVFVYDDNFSVFKQCELSKLFSTGFVFDHICSYIDGGEHKGSGVCSVYGCNTPLSIKEIVYYDLNPEIGSNDFGGRKCQKHWCGCMDRIHSTPWSYLLEGGANERKTVCKNCK